MTKKILAIGMSLAMIASLAACSNKETVKEVEKEPVKVEDTVNTDALVNGAIAGAGQAVKDAIQEDTETTENVNDKETATEETEKPAMGGNVQIANPYVDLKSAEEMMDAANLEVNLPTSIPDWVTETIYRAMPEKLIEVIYKDDVNEIRVRVATGSDDISGVYGSDGEVKTVDVNGQKVEFTMIDGRTVMAKWTNDMPRTYSITSTEGIPEDVMTKICSEVK